MLTFCQNLAYYRTGLVCSLNVCLLTFLTCLLCTTALADDDVTEEDLERCVSEQLRSDVEGYLDDPNDSDAQTARWKRVLAAFGEDNGHTPMTWGELFNHDVTTTTGDELVSRHDWERWGPVQKALECLEGIAFSKECQEGVALTAEESCAKGASFTPPEPGIFHVSPRGNDAAGTGAKDNPWATLERARQAVAAHIESLGSQGMSQDIIVYLHSGTHRLFETFNLGPNDSGNNGFKVLYRNYPNQEPTISGGKVLTGWRASEEHSGFFEKTVSAGDRFRELYINDERGIRAREPNIGSYRGTKNHSWDIDDQESRLKNLTISSDHDRLGSQDSEFTLLIEMPDDAISQVEYWQLTHFRYVQLPIESFNIDTSDSTLGIAVVQGEDAQADAWRVSKCCGAQDLDSPYYWENALEFIDTGGEWFLDEVTSKVYYMPRPDDVVNGNLTAEMTVPVVETLVSFEDAQNIWFHGIRFEHSNYTLPSTRGYVQRVPSLTYRHEDAHNPISSGVDDQNTVATAHAWPASPGGIEIRNSSNIHFERNAFKHFAANGLVLHEGAKNIGIEGNVFSGIGDTHIVLHGGLDPTPTESEQLRGISIVNNVMEEGGAGDKLGTAVFAGYPDRAYIDHNYVAHAAGGGFNIGWNKWAVGQMPGLRNNSVRYNLFEGLLTRVRDWGLVHLKSATDAGVVHTDVSRNWAKDIHNRFGSKFFVGWYLDDRTNRARAVENVTTGVGSANTGFENVYLQRAYSGGAAQNNTVNRNFLEDTKRKWSFPHGDASHKLVEKYGAEDQPTIDLVKANAGLQPEFKSLIHLKDGGPLGGSVAPIGGVAGMVSRWPMDRSADDAMPIRNDLQTSGTLSYSTDAIQGAYSLSIDSTSDYAEVSGYKGILGSTSRSFCAWVKTLDSDAVIVSWGSDVGGGKWVVRTQSASGISGALSVDVNGGHIVGSTVVADGEWHHIAVVFENDGTPNVQDVRMYVDGLLQTFSHKEAEAVLTMSGEDLRFGSSALGVGVLSGLLIDDARLYDRPLLASEVAHLAVKRVEANWSFEDNLVDASGNGHTLTLHNGAAFSMNGVVGSASLDLDGVDDYALATGYAGVTGAGPRTISAWIRTTDTSGTIVAWGTRSSARAAVDFSIVPGPGGGVLRLSDGDGAATGTTNVADGEWHHVAVTWADDGLGRAADFAQLHVDGYPDSTPVASQRQLNTSDTASVHIGVAPWNTSDLNHLFAGEMDNIRIFSEALTPLEINEMARR